MNKRFIQGLQTHESGNGQAREQKTLLGFNFKTIECRLVTGNDGEAYENFLGSN